MKRAAAGGGVPGLHFHRAAAVRTGNDFGPHRLVAPACIAVFLIRRRREEPGAAAFAQDAAGGEIAPQIVCEDVSEALPQDFFIRRFFRVQVSDQHVSHLTGGISAG